MNPPRKPQLVCPAGSLRALQAAVDAGADAVYLGLKDATNARNFAGLNFDDAQVREGVRYAHARGREVLMALNTFANARDDAPWRSAVDRAAEFGADALIVADTAVMAYARDHHPGLRLHLSVQRIGISNGAGSSLNCNTSSPHEVLQWNRQGSTNSSAPRSAWSSRA